MSTPHGPGAEIALAADRLDDPELVEAGDPAGMLRQVASSAAQVRTALRTCAETDLSALRPDSRPRAIVVAGTGGGSGIVGDLLAAICGAGAPVQIANCRGYQLPGWVGAADLVIAVSCSGSTRETLAAATEAARRGCDLVAVGGAGSPLQRVAERVRAAFIPVTSAGMPRSTLWGLAIPLLVIAERLGVTRVGADAYEAAAVAMEDVSHQCRPASESFVNPGKSLALDLVGALPLIWGGSALAGVAARRFASQLSTNAKHPATAGVLPDAAHDQVAVFDGPFAPGPEPDFPAAEDFRESAAAGAGVMEFDDGADLRMSLRLVLLADAAGEHPEVTRLREAAGELAEQRGIAVSRLATDGEDPLRRLAGLIQLVDYATVYLAVASGIDPFPVTAIEDLKERIAELP